MKSAARRRPAPRGLQRGDGILVTSSDFTPAAITEAAATRIELVGSNDLLRDSTTPAPWTARRSDDITAAYQCPTCATPYDLAHSPYGWWIRCPNTDATASATSARTPSRARAILSSH